MQGSWVDFRDQLSFKDFWKFFESKDPPKVTGRSSRSKIIEEVPPTFRVGKSDGKFFPPDTDVDDNSNVSVDNVVYMTNFDNRIFFN